MVNLTFLFVCSFEISNLTVNNVSLFLSDAVRIVFCVVLSTLLFHANRFLFVLPFCMLYLAASFVDFTCEVIDQFSLEMCVHLFVLALACAVNNSNASLWRCIVKRIGVTSCSTNGISCVLQTAKWRSCSLLESL